MKNSARVSFVDEFGPVIHLVVELMPGLTPSGLSWTASRRPSEPVTFGTQAQVKIVTGQRAPINFVVG
ncbi:MAG: hypothetical protein ACRDO9_05740 [Gaiellales bacterium]